MPVDALIPHAAELKEKAFDLYYKDRMQLVQISEQLGIPKSTIQKWSSHGKWKARSVLLSQPKQARALRTQLKAQGGAGAIAAGRPLTDAELLGQQLDSLIAEIEKVPFSRQQADYKRREAALAMLSLRAIRAAAENPLLMLQSADKIEKLSKWARKALDLEESKPQVIIHVGRMASGLPLAEKQVQSAHELPTSEPLTLDNPTGLMPVDDAYDVGSGASTSAVSLDEGTNKEG